MCCVQAFAQKTTVTGVVSDENGEALSGAIVVAKDKDGNTVATSMADASGIYSIECTKGDRIEFHFLGYQTQAETVKNSGKINISLIPDASTRLEDVVVIGYGAVKKADLTGSVSNVKMAEVRDVPTPSLDVVLQGRVAGLDIVTSDGEPGAASSIRIRGTRSITASNDPLIIVDGVMDAVTDINDVNPSDVESISVLKDASSTAIYGARGANGVILITTKGSGENIPEQKISVTFKAQGGVSWLPKSLDIMDATEFSLYRDMYMQYSGTTSWMNMQSPLSDLSVKDPYSKGSGTDWIKEVSRVASYSNYFISMNGFAGKHKFYASLNYNDEDGIIKRSGKKTYTATLNVSNSIFKWLNLSANLRYQFRHQDNNLTAIGGTGIYYAAVYMSPLIDPSDSYNRLEPSGTRVNNPAVRLKELTNELNRSLLNATLTAKATLAKNLYVNAKFSFNSLNRNWYWFWPSTLPDKSDGEGAEAQRQNYMEMTFYNEETINYGKTFRNGHHIDVMAGFTADTFKSDKFQLYGKGYLVDTVLWNNMNAVTDKETYVASSDLIEKLKLAAFARLNWNYSGRYYITGTLRADGASNFAANRKWGLFPSAAFKWVISKEPFMKSAAAVDDLSLKLSAGRSGNDLNEAYRSLPVMSSTTGGYLFGGSQPVGYYQSRIASPDLTWEKTDSYNVSLEGSFFNSRLAFTAEAYLAMTSDLLLTVQVPKQTGYSTKYGNVGRTTTKGAELTINSRNVIMRNFTWSTGFTIASSSSIVNDIGFNSYVSQMNSPEGGYMMAGYKVGYPVNSFWGFQYAGVWHNAEEVARNNKTKTYADNSSTHGLGYPKYVDVNHDGSLDSSDLCYLGSPDPLLSGGLQNTFTINKFNIGIFFTYSLGGKVYNYSEYYMAGSRRTNQYRYMMNAWHPVLNPDSDLPRAGIMDGSNVPSSFMVHDASFIRLKNVSAGYTFSFKTNWIRELKLNVSGENLCLWSKYNGFDPDVSGNGIRRMDYISYPKAARVVFTAQMKF